MSFGLEHLGFDFEQKCRGIFFFSTMTGFSQLRIGSNSRLMNMVMDFRVPKKMGNFLNR